MEDTHTYFVMFVWNAQQLSSLFRLAGNRTRDLLGAPPWGALAENRTHNLHCASPPPGLEPVTAATVEKHRSLATSVRLHQLD